jgi:hypothetical protein
MVPVPGCTSSTAAMASVGGYRLVREGWVDDDLPYSWFAGGANHLDPVVRRWALRHAGDLGVDEVTFGAPGHSAS